MWTQGGESAKAGSKTWQPWVSLITSPTWGLRCLAREMVPLSGVAVWQWINVFMGYFSALGILLLIPLDVLVTKLRREAGDSYQYDKLGEYSNSLYGLYS
jgi:hypothetical protein